MSSGDVEAQGKRKWNDVGSTSPLSDSKEEASGNQLGLHLEQITNGEKKCETDLDPALLAKLSSGDFNTSCNFPNANLPLASSSGHDQGVKMIATPAHPNRTGPNEAPEKDATPNHVQHSDKGVVEGSQSSGTCSEVKTNCLGVFDDIDRQNKGILPTSVGVDFISDMPLGCDSSKMQIQDSQATVRQLRGTPKGDLESITTTSAKHVGEIDVNARSFPSPMTSNAEICSGPPRGSCKRENPQALSDAFSYQRKAEQKYCLSFDARLVKEKYLEAKKYSHLCSKLSKVPKVHLKRLLFVKSKVKPISGGAKKERTIESKSGLGNHETVKPGSKTQKPQASAVKYVTAVGGMPKFTAVKTATASGGKLVRTAAGKPGVPVLNALCVKPSPPNFSTLAKRVSPSAGNKASKGVGANTMQSLQVVVVHPKAHSVQSSGSSVTLERYTELLNQLKEAVPGFESSQTEDRLLHPGEPGMPLRSYCTCGMAGSDYATKYHFSPDDRRKLEINNVTRVVINNFAFLAFYREDKLFLSYTELVELQVMDSSIVPFTDLLKEYPPTVEKSKCVDIMTNQEFAYVQFRCGTPSSLGLITLGMFRRLVLQGQIKWKVFENPKFAGLPLGHLCPKTARDLFFYPHSIFDMDKISQSPAGCQMDYTMHVGQICFVKNPVWVFECSKMVFINLEQFFIANELGNSMLETAYSMLRRLGVILADAPEAVCNTILPLDFDPRKPLSLCSAWVRLRSLGEVLEELGTHPSMEANSPQQTLVQRMAWLVKEIRSQDILWRTDVAFSF